MPALMRGADPRVVEWCMLSELRDGHVYDIDTVIGVDWDLRTSAKCTRCGNFHNPYWRSEKDIRETCVRLDLPAN